MVAIRISNSLNALRATRVMRAPQVHRTFITTPRFYAQQGYGDGKGSPEGENPQKQPQHSDAQESSEHPGPPPPDVGKKGSGATKTQFTESMDNAASPEEASAQSGGSRSKEAKETGSSPTGGSVPNADQHTTGGTPTDSSTARAASQDGGEALKGPQGKGSPSPKIHNQAMPAAKEGLSDEQKQEVERHNADFDKRHDRASPAEADKVDKKFWKGTGGREGTETDWNA